jgi:hypothetical protein
MLSYCRWITTTPTTHGCEYDEHKQMSKKDEGEGGGGLHNDSMI